jgi:MFS family permease
LQVSSTSVTQATVQQQQLLQCSYPNPCWCDVSSTARAWFITLRMVATAVAALPAAWLSRLAGRRAATFTGVVLVLIGEYCFVVLLENPGKNAKAVILKTVIG